MVFFLIRFVCGYLLFKPSNSISHQINLVFFFIKLLTDLITNFMAPSPTSKILIDLVYEYLYDPKNLPIQTI